MKYWFSRLASVFAPPAPPPAHGATNASVASAAEAAEVRPKPAAAPPVAATAINPEHAFCTWLMQGAVAAHAPAGPREQRALAHLDQLLADSAAHKRLLPRSAGVVPPILAQLRGDTPNLSALTQLVARDVTLVAEVVRMANSPFYRRHEAVVALEHALQLLGVEGLRRAVARAILQPMIEQRGSEFLTRCAKRLWLHAERKAQLCAALAGERGGDAFEGYVLALAHNAAWSALLRALDQAQPQTTWHLANDFVAALGTRRDRLTAVVAAQWQLGGELRHATERIAQHGLAQAAHAGGHGHATALHRADHLATLLCLAPSVDAAAAASALLGQHGPATRACFDAWSQPEPAPAAPLKHSAAEVA
jgi:HD-like signal output (HDOD) protein